MADSNTRQRMNSNQDVCRRWLSLPNESTSRLSKSNFDPPDRLFFTAVERKIGLEDWCAPNAIEVMAAILSCRSTTK
jgi:hypothetical protein